MDTIIYNIANGIASNDEWNNFLNQLRISTPDEIKIMFCKVKRIQYKEELNKERLLNILTTQYCDAVVKDTMKTHRILSSGPTSNPRYELEQYYKSCCETK